MQEYSTLVLVLDIVPAGDCDARVFLFTEKLGRVSARAKSLRKINSKLAAHLQPGMLTRVRLVEKNGFQVVDALAMQNPSPQAVPSLLQREKKREQIQILQMIKHYAEDGHPDALLWSVLVSGKLASRQLLKVLGFDPEHARCRTCEAINPSYFIIKDTSYECRSCYSNLASPSFHHGHSQLSIA